MCVAGYLDSEGRFEEELDRIANAARLGLSHVYFDFEPDDAAFCQALDWQWGLLMGWDVDGDGVTDCGTLEEEYVNPTYNACDAWGKDLLRQDGTLLWQLTYDALRGGGEAFVSGPSADGVHDPTHPEIGNWLAAPGSFSLGNNGYADVDQLYPQVFSYAMPSLYDHPKEADATVIRSLYDSAADGGLMVRRDLLSVMALGGDPPAAGECPRLRARPRRVRLPPALLRYDG